MVKVIKVDKEYLLVTERGKAKRYGKLKGGPRTSFTVLYRDSVYKKAGGGIKRYPYPYISIGNIDIRCPEELAGRRVRIKVEVIKLPGDDKIWKKKKMKKK